ncbi:MAG TPA: prenyltransferase/squalene oxidase repeat-containing protein [Candidatus Deferrimicrobium sp.]|nr:prenyltransferase/squalene oxidase repeat-containing protein [Candidatus Deferrimicrobium sp.]
MTDWLKSLKFDPISPLTSSKNAIIAYFTQRDLLEEKVEPIETIWKLSTPMKIVKKQQSDGSWKYPSKIHPHTNYSLLETFRNLGWLVEKYGFNKKHPAIEKAIEYLFSSQTDEGDFRGIYGNQYSPNYTSAILSLVIRAGYETDPRVEKCFRWLLSNRQDDGGWAIPMRTRGVKIFDEVYANPAPFKPVTSKPSSHWVTGIVLRAFAAHSIYRNSKETRIAGKLLESRLFLPDKYPDRRSIDHWEKFSFPFWWTDLLSALDSLSWIGFRSDEPQIKKALEWFIAKQDSSGRWNLKLLMTGTDKDLNLWLCFAICRVFKRFF